MKKFIFASIFCLAVASLFATPFTWNFHGQMYVMGKSSSFYYNKSVLPQDNIRVFNFEKTVHVYMKIKLTNSGQTYESDIIPFAKKDLNAANTHLLNPEEADIKVFAENLLKANNLPKDASTTIDIDIVSNDFDNDSVRVDIKGNDICIRNYKVPEDIPALFK